ncbi:hypothetical protein N2152v2_010581 [Parachlorella kessleri]
MCRLSLFSSRRAASVPRRGGSPQVRAAWGADVQFTPAKVLERQQAATLLHTVQIDLGPLAEGYTQPGQFVQVKVGDSKPGFFAIASPPDPNNAGVVELLIKDQPGSTAELLCKAQPGDEVLVSPVMGKGFPVSRVPPGSHPTLLLFATGSGVSPIRALLESEEALQAAQRSEVRLYYGARTPEAMAYRERVAEWEAAGVKVVPVYSEKGEGYVQDVFSKENGIEDWSGVAAVLCGHKGMCEAITEANRACASPSAGFMGSTTRTSSRFQVAAAAGAAGAGDVPATATASAADAAPAAAKPKAASKARLPSLDALRFFLIAYIAVGHFVAFATTNPFLLQLLTQVNMWNGAFFVLSGYVAGYTATELGKYEASPRVKPAAAYTVARVMGYYPLFALVQVLFGAMFVFADYTYNGPIKTLAHGIMSTTLVQAWFPKSAEIWNAPTWFLSALTFAMIVLPHVLPTIAAMRKAGLKRLLAALTGFSLLGKLAYSYDLNVWSILEGMTSARAHPNVLLFNVTRFHPFYALLEVLMGVAAARLVMLEGVDDEGKPLGTPPKPAGSAVWPALALVGITVARAAGYLQLNDMLSRALLFTPLFTLLIVRLHRNTLAGAKGLTGLLGHPLLTYLGTISFPIFIVHGALGQLFYKKVIATKVWGGVMPQSFFPLYCGIVLLAAAACQHLFLENKKVQEFTSNVTKKLSAAF